MTKIRTAVIGAGKVADVHASILTTLPDAEFVAVCSRTLEKAQVLAARYNAKAYTEVSTMIKESGVQAVIICTPHPAHASPAVQAMECGAHVLVEKPLAVSLADCDEMLAAAECFNVKLSVISQRRWYAPSIRVKTALHSGKIGKPILATLTLLGWRSQAYYESDPWRGRWDTEGGGVLVNQAPHLLDLFLWYMGEIAEVFGCWANLNHPYIEVEDTALAIIRFKSGALGNIVLSNSQNPGLYGNIHIFGENGTAIGVQPEGGSMFIAGMTTVQEPPINDLWTVQGEADFLPQWQEEDRRFFTTIDPIKHYFTLQLEDFLSAIRQDRDPSVTGIEGRRVVELFNAIYRSQESRQPVQFPLT